MPALPDLLRRGYFPKELPTPFTTSTYALALTSAPPPSAFTATKRNAHLVRHSLARPGRLNRTVALPHPVPYYQLAEAIATGWTTLRPRLTSSPFSITVPIDDPRSLRAVVASEDSNVEEKRTLFRATSGYLVKADVSQWYPSTYTHSFAWALHGKAAVKAALGRSTGGRTLGDRLDRYVRRAQANQTIGMPIGPDTSFVLGELILARCDEALSASAPRKIRGFRFYDDYELFVPSAADADEALSALQTALTEYELTLNPYKVQVIELPHPVEDEWVSSLKRIFLRGNRAQERSDITLLFDEGFRLARRYPNDHVLAYAVGRFIDRYNRERHRISSSNWPHLERLLLASSLAEPGVLQKAVHLIAWAEKRGWPVDRQLIGQSLNLLAGKEAQRGHASEVAWAIWAAISLGVKLRAPASSAVSRLDDDVVALTALHARETGTLGPGLDTRAWEAHATADGLWANHWLLAYEAVEHKWIKPRIDYIAAEPWAAHLRAHKVRFYDVKATLPPPPPVVLKPDLQVKLRAIEGY